MAHGPRGRKGDRQALGSILRGVRGSAGTFGRPEGRSWPQRANPLTLNSWRQSSTNGDKRQQADAPQKRCHMLPYVAIRCTTLHVLHAISDIPPRLGLPPIRLIDTKTNFSLALFPPGNKEPGHFNFSAQVLWPGSFLFHVQHIPSLTNALHCHTIHVWHVAEADPRRRLFPVVQLTSSGRVTCRIAFLRSTWWPMRSGSAAR